MIAESVIQETMNFLLSQAQIKKQWMLEWCSLLLKRLTTTKMAEIISIVLDWNDEGVAPEMLHFFTLCAEFNPLLLISNMKAIIQFLFKNMDDSRSRKHSLLLINELSKANKLSLLQVSSVSVSH